MSIINPSDGSSYFLLLIRGGSRPLYARIRKYLWWAAMAGK
jgi:hypothetical protein